MSKKLSNNQILLKECIKQEFDDSIGYSNENDYFEHFSCVQVLKDYNLSDEEIDSGSTGGGNDGGCDGIYIFLNDELLMPDQIDSIVATRGSKLDFIIVQAKNVTSFNEDVIMKWKTISENLLGMDWKIDNYKSRYNEIVLEKFSMFRDIITKLIRSQLKINFHYYYVTLACEKHPNVINQSDELKEVVKRYYPSATVNVEFVEADRLMELYYSDSEARVTLDLADQPISLQDNDYVALVKLGTYYKFITDEKGMLRKAFFESNVRDYQGNNSVNSSIAETLSSDSKEDFWWLNNGVTILASEVTFVTNRSLQLVNPEIVNGLQTSREVFNYFGGNPEKLNTEKRSILVRIINPESEESRDNIIFATNNQTSIPKSSLRVTDTIHLQIEMYFKSRGLYYDRRKNYYKNQKKKSADIISVSFLAQCLITLLLRKPDFARARPSTLLTDEETYKFLYENNNDLESYYKAAKIGRIIQNTLKMSTEMTSAESNDILFYVIYAVVASRLKTSQITFNDIKEFDLDSLQENEIEELRKIIFNRYKQLGGNGRIAKSNSFVDEVDMLVGL